MEQPPATPGLLIKLGRGFKAAWTMSKHKMINRPSVAKAILQSPLSLIAKLQISPHLPVQQKKSGRPYNWVVVRCSVLRSDS